MHVEDINVQSRYAGGVRVMRVGENDKVVTVAATPRNDEEDVVSDEDVIEVEATDVTDAPEE